MNYIEELKKIHPEKVSNTLCGGAQGCPADYFQNAPHCLSESNRDCVKCWRGEAEYKQDEYQYIKSCDDGVQINKLVEVYKKAKDAKEFADLLRAYHEEESIGFGEITFATEIFVKVDNEIKSFFPTSILYCKDGSVCVRNDEFIVDSSVYNRQWFIDKEKAYESINL